MTIRAGLVALVTTFIGQCLPAAASAALMLSAAGALAEEPCKPLAGVTMVDMAPSRSGRPEIPVTIAGQSRALILDTGAYITSLTPDAVTDLKLTRSHTNMGLRTSWEMCRKNSR